MPSQISHILFAEDVLDRALGGTGKTLLKRHGPLFRFGAQGPDFFYHNKRTRPTGIKYGLATHREGYGRVVKNMLIEAQHLRQRGMKPRSYKALSAYILGFVTHAFLDKAGHPFINYFSGWVEFGQPETNRYFRCHAFMERIIDVLLLEHLRGREIRSYTVTPLLNCGDKLPYPVLKTLIKGFHASYPEMTFKSLDRKRVENAYSDAMSFYVYTDPVRIESIRSTGIFQPGGERDRRHLALVHPLYLPDDIDFLNLRHQPWQHPCGQTPVETASFLDLYARAIDTALPVLKTVGRILFRRDDPQLAEELIGNESLSTGLAPGKDGKRCVQKYSDPLPLGELIEAQYEQFSLHSVLKP